MRETPLITIARADDSGCGTREPGDLDYIIHGEPLAQWLSKDPENRTEELVDELRSLAGKLERGEHPFAVSLKIAHRRGQEPDR